MDTLETNLPQLLPSRHRKLPRALMILPTAENTRKQTLMPRVLSKEAGAALEDDAQQQTNRPKLSNIIGDRGVTYDERRFSKTARHCDEIFLDCLLEHLKLVDIIVLIYMDPLNAMQRAGGPDGPTIDPHDLHRDHRLKGAVVIARKIIPEVQRLRTHPELFSDELKEAYFLEKAGILAYRTRELLDISDQLDKLDPLQRKNFNTAAAKRSTDRETGVTKQAWETFAGPMRYGQVKGAPSNKEMQAQLPDMLPISGQVLPPGAVMIAEHNRQREDWFLGTGTNVPEDMLAVQHSSSALLNETKIRVGVEAFIKRACHMPAQTPQNSGLAWGQQERGAEMGSYMAHMEQDITTMPGHARPPAAFLTTFLSKEGARPRKEAHIAEKDVNFMDLT